MEGDLTVRGFADYPGVAPDGMVDAPVWRRQHFNGTPAPTVRIAVHGDKAWVDRSNGIEPALAHG